MAMSSTLIEDVCLTQTNMSVRIIDEGKWSHNWSKIQTRHGNAALKTIFGSRNGQTNWSCNDNGNYDHNRANPQ
eukprot:scaffold92624_cov18-Prasinocladus_malaysianus.AAC.1